MSARYQGLRHLEIEEPEPGLLIVRLNRPEVHNALNTATSEDLAPVGPARHTQTSLRS
jgi:hypothetical protein